MLEGFNAKEIAFVVFVVICVLAIAILQPYFEMTAFNRLTGQNATYMDAVFSNLRITGCN